MSSVRILGVPNRAKTDTEKLLAGNNSWAGTQTFSYAVLPTAQPGSPVSGQTYFNASTNTLYVFNGSAWKSVVLA